jgi:glucose-1-phosphate thymidylyltransferase
MWGIVPVASSEHSVVEPLVERMLRAGATRICFVIAPDQTHLLDRFGGAIGFAHVCYTVQSQPRGLNDAVFCALPLIHSDEEVLVAPLDSVWFPEDALSALPRGVLSFLLFRAQSGTDPAVVMDDFGYVREIRSDAADARSAWTWRAFKAPVRVLRELQTLWLRRDRRDTQIETLVNEHFRRGGRARGVRAGSSYLPFDASPDRREALQLMTQVAQDQAVDIGPYLEPERAGVWSLGRAQPLPPSGDNPTSPSAA